jgi:hypothetical protein
VHRLDSAKFWPYVQPLNSPSINPLSQRMTQLETLVAQLQQTIQPAHASNQSQTNVTVTKQPISSTSGTTPMIYHPLIGLADATGKKPRSLRLPDGAIQAIDSWSDLLVECCLFTLANNLQVSLPFPDKSGRKISLISPSPPPLKAKHSQTQYKGMTVYIYTNYSSNYCVANALHILGQTPRSIQSTEAAVAF